MPQLGAAAAALAHDLRKQCGFGAFDVIVGVPAKKNDLKKTSIGTRFAAKTLKPGSKRIARSFGKLGVDEESDGGPDRFLPSAIFDPPGQRLKLPAMVPAFSYGARRSTALANVKSWKGFP